MQQECKRCSGTCKKAGRQLNGVQKYRCKSCGLYQQKNYVYLACKRETHEQFSKMNRLGCGTNKMARFLGISINTLQKWIEKFEKLKAPLTNSFGGVFDIDEMQTCVGKRRIKFGLLMLGKLKNEWQLRFI